jgi:hypothetical protein
MPKRLVLGEKSTWKTNNLSRCKPSSVKLQEILSWKCPSAFLVWEFMGEN